MTMMPAARVGAGLQERRGRWVWEEKLRVQLQSCKCDMLVSHFSPSSTQEPGDHEMLVRHGHPDGPHGCQ